MSLAPGTRLGVYEVAAQIGEGGMGQVYRARDTRLNRDVALKVLPDSFAGDSDRLARFTREAQTLASLNHPNIAAIHGLEESGGVRALVMELVEGDDLSQRIARGAIPLDEALPIARQIAEALEAAHEQGIIHRDLKPANVKVRADGTVKVLDFGLAKAMDSGLGAGDPRLAHASQAPTITTPAMTQAGMILGTAAYMSPEQARGKTVDKRADIWAFGAVVFEMLTGRRAFPGEDVTDTIVSVISKEPEWSALPSAAPAGLRRLLGRCLKKDVRARLRDIGEARVQVEDLLSGAPGDVSAVVGGAVTTQTTAAAESSARSARLAWMVASGAVLAFVALTVPAMRHLGETPPPAPPETRTEIVTPATDDPTSFALSPDGRQIVFVASGDGQSRLWLRSLAMTDAQPLAGTEGAMAPFWSPDSQSVGFFADSALKRFDLGGGAPQTLAPALAAYGGTWNADSVIVFAPGLNTPLMRVSATGGDVEPVTTLGPQQQFHRFPSFLPDGRQFLFRVNGAPDVTGIYLGTLDGSQTRLTPADGAGAYLTGGSAAGGASRPAGWLLWVRAGTLVARRLDLPEVALTGEPVTVADGAGAVSVATTGLVAYRTAVSRQQQLTWVDRSGIVRGTVGEPDATYAQPRISPDGRRVAVARTVQGNREIWLLDGTRTSRFTFAAGNDQFPVWSPDGTRIVFTSNRAGQLDLYEKRTSGASVEERFVASDQPKVPMSWSKDGRFLLYHSTDPPMGTDLWAVPMTGDRKPAVFLKTPFRETVGTFSPDGRWVAYQSDETGRPEVYVRPFVPPDASGTKAGASEGQWQVSTAGGIHPVWRPDGKELYYLNPRGAMMAAPIIVTGSTLEPGTPVELFLTSIYGGGVDAQQGRHYDVAPDGRFLINTEIASASAPITLIQNWRPDTTP